MQSQRKPVPSASPIAHRTPTLPTLPAKDQGRLQLLNGRRPSMDYGWILSTGSPGRLLSGGGAPFAGGRTASQSHHPSLGRRRKTCNSQRLDWIGTIKIHTGFEWHNWNTVTLHWNLDRVAALSGHHGYSLVPILSYSFPRSQIGLAEKSRVLPVRASKAGKMDTDDSIHYTKLRGGAALSLAIDITLSLLYVSSCTSTKRQVRSLAQDKTNKPQSF